MTITSHDDDPIKTVCKDLKDALEHFVKLQENPNATLSQFQEGRALIDALMAKLDVLSQGR